MRRRKSRITIAHIYEELVKLRSARSDWEELLRRDRLECNVIIAGHIQEKEKLQDKLDGLDRDRKHWEHMSRLAQIKIDTLSDEVRRLQRQQQKKRGRKRPLHRRR